MGTRHDGPPRTHDKGFSSMNNNKGFTLIELLIVVVIIGILAAIAIPKFSATRDKAYFAAMKSDMQNLARQQEIYYADNYAYTTSNTAMSFVSSNGVTVSIAASSSGWAATATHSELGASQGCSMYYGTATPTAVGTANPTSPGEVACTS
ncbi:MAG: prepilin-type N-terminal cleavage/methylation domain-containing protein [Gemmatimonadetes bacterium]|nr:prepilin-type N-terminal cleavage/methylation domain-containing protein [Gemmatimonadota bacterium]